jgi:phage I-like protein
MSQILKLTAAVTDATKALNAAPAKEKSAFAAKLALAESALSKELAKVTKDKKTVTHVHESESASESMSGSSGSESSESSSSSSSGSASESHESEDKEALASAVMKLTGKSTPREAMGALEALAANAAVAPKMGKRLARLEATHRSSKVEALIAAGKEAAKITPGNESKAREIAAKYGTKALAAFIDAAAPAVTGNVEPAEELEGGVTITAEQRKIWTKMGYSEKDFPKLLQDEQKLAAKRGAR